MNTLIKIIAVVLIVMLFPFVLWADTTTEELAVLASFALIDYSQSVTMFYKSEGYHEINPLLGPSPSREDLVLFGTIGIGLTYVLTKILPDSLKQVVIDSVIATERFNIEENRLVIKGWNTDGPPLNGRTLAGIPIIISLRF